MLFLRRRKNQIDEQGVVVRCYRLLNASTIYLRGHFSDPLYFSCHTESIVDFRIVWLHVCDISYRE